MNGSRPSNEGKEDNIRTMVPYTKVIKDLYYIVYILINWIERPVPFGKFRCNQYLSRAIYVRSIFT